jgi:hypothetical protein
MGPPTIRPADEPPGGIVIVDSGFGHPKLRQGAFHGPVLFHGDDLNELPLLGKLFAGFDPFGHGLILDRHSGPWVWLVPLSGEAQTLTTPPPP